MHSYFSGLVHIYIYIQTNTETILYPFALSHWLFNLVLNLYSLIIIHYSSMFIILVGGFLLQRRPSRKKHLRQDSTKAGETRRYKLKMMRTKAEAIAERASA
jgi:predicted membrane protein